MKKLLFIPLILLLISTFSCKKNENGTLAISPEYFIFGTSGGYCASNCAKYYILQNGQIYPADKNTSPGTLQFSSIALSQDKFQLSKPLIDSFPAYLNHAPGSSILCKSCADQATIYIEYKLNGTVITWNIDEAGTTIPADIKAYIEKMSGTLSQL